MDAPSALVICPPALHAGLWGAGPRVKPELVSVWTHLRRHAVETTVLDLEVELGVPDEGAEESFLERAEALIGERDASLVAVACLATLQFGAALAVAGIVRRLHPDAVIAVFGHHATVRSADFVFEGTPFDWVIAGDPEVSLAEIARDAAASGREPRQCRVGRGEVLTLDAESAPDYASYPYIARDLPSLGVYLSRGCQYRDAVCYAGAGGGRWHAYPPDVALQILSGLEESSPREIDVLDPTLGLDTGWRRALLERLAAIERRTVPLSVTARPDAFARADVDSLYSGRIHLHLNVGTLSVALLSALDVPEPGRRVGQVLDLIRYINAKGVPTELDLVFGQPGETRQTAAETLDTLAALIAALPNTSLRLAAQPWAFFPFGDEELDVATPARRYGTEIVHPEWWREDLSAVAAAHAVVPSADLADLEPGDAGYWRPRFDDLRAALDDKLTQEARRGLRSHESVGSAAEDVPHGFYREPRWH
jgi:hypothetical protein